MFIYKDYSYIEYVMSLEFKEGFKLFKSCQDRIKDIEEQRQKERWFKMFLLDVQNGFNGTFDDYYKNRKEAAESNSLTSSERQVEEERIIKKFETMDDNKLKRRV